MESERKSVIFFIIERWYCGLKMLELGACEALTRYACFGLAALQISAIISSATALLLFNGNFV